MIRFTFEMEDCHVQATQMQGKDNDDGTREPSYMHVQAVDFWEMKKGETTCTAEEWCAIAALCMEAGENSDWDYYNRNKLYQLAESVVEKLGVRIIP